MAPGAPRLLEAIIASTTLSRPHVIASGSNAVTKSAAYLTTLKTTWNATLRRAGVLYFPLYYLRHTFASGLSAGGVSDHFVTLTLRQGDAQVFKRYSQAKLNMKREALTKLDRTANEHSGNSATAKPN